jgi:hypothetical protein
MLPRSAATRAALVYISVAIAARGAAGTIPNISITYIYLLLCNIHFANVTVIVCPAVWQNIPTEECNVRTEGFQHWPACMGTII